MGDKTVHSPYAIRHIPLQITVDIPSLMEYNAAMNLNTSDPSNQLDLFVDHTQTKCVHTEHCCIVHGCKYGDEDCPVASKTKHQSFPCFICWEESQPISNEGW